MIFDGTPVPLVSMLNSLCQMSWDRGYALDTNFRPTSTNMSSTSLLLLQQRSFGTALGSFAC
ncbi:hypothetical protein PG999_003729 [Apiospora kogelbergensis]|uniref:Uncharacterized protein n=1 Tax=Apiospora kogelbergensis TaxID=1337665 RepID=A0AAW0R4J0_9PEZI